MAVGIVLAGRRNVGRLRAVAPDCEWEALLPLAGRPMAGYVVAALTAARDVGEVVVAGPEALATEKARSIAPGADLIATLAAALDAIPKEEEEVVVAAGDAPLLSAAAVTELVAESRRRALAFGYPIVERAACQARYPGVRRTYARLREGSFTGGNCLFIRRPALPALLALAERFYAARKRPLRLAGMLGWRLVVGLALGVAALEEAERAGTRLLGHRAGAVLSTDPGIGVDVDKPEDLELCRRMLSGGFGGRGEVGGP